MFIKKYFSIGFRDIINLLNMKLDIFKLYQNNILEENLEFASVLKEF